jgi:hypothetical protein
MMEEVHCSYLQPLPLLKSREGFVVLQPHATSRAQMQAVV